MSHVLAERWVVLMLDASFKGIVVCVAACFALMLFRRSSASRRSLLLSLTMAGILALPLMERVLPSWHMSMSARPVLWPLNTIVAADIGGDLVGPRPAAAAMLRNSFGSIAMREAPAQPVIPHPRRRWPALAFWMWAAGAAFYASKLFVGHIAARRIQSIGQDAPADGLLNMRVRHCSRLLDVNDTVKVFTTPDGISPMTRGIVRPILLLPAGSEQWPLPRLDAVIAHELAHVGRHDRLAQVISQLACMTYWFNPLTWLLARLLASECERACDDRVLLTGAKSHDYAAHLLAVLCGLRNPNVPACAALAMTHPRRPIERRVRAILSNARRRTRPTFINSAFIACAVAIAIVPLAALQPSVAMAGPATQPAKASAAAKGDKAQPLAPDEADETPLASVQLNGKSMTIAQAPNGIRLSGGSIDWSLRPLTDGMTFSSRKDPGAATVTIHAGGSGMISGNGAQILIQSDGRQSTVEGVGLRITVERDLFIIKDREGMEVRVKDHNVTASDPRRLKLVQASRVT